MDVEWRIIEEFPRYSVSSTGSVRNNTTGRILKASKSYLYVDLYFGGNHKVIAVHRLVAKAFIENPQNKDCIDHIDTNKENNNVSNLRWVTHRENTNNPPTLEAVVSRCCLGKRKTYRGYNWRFRL